MIAIKFFTGEWTIFEIQLLCEAELGNTISPTLVEDLVKRIHQTYPELPMPVKPNLQTHLNQTDRVSNTLAAIAAHRLEEIDFCGEKRWIDFSQFKVRGHYENSELLQHYFRAMMWCGTIDFRFVEDGSETSLRQLATAIVLHDLLKRSQRFEQWQQVDHLLQTFVGQTDSMTFAQLDACLMAANVRSPAEIDSLDTLAQIQALMMSQALGEQQIMGHPYMKTPGETKPLQLPRSFTVMGQKFVLDSWALSQVVFDRIQWDNQPVPRRVPSSLDVAFAVLGNDQVVPQLVERITNPQGHPFRDGLPYQHHLAALRETIDQLDETVWQSNLYLNWLATLRALSAPTTTPDYPEAMRTHAWAMKTLNTQLASWTQLRHDTLLYVKQSYTGGILCFYPAGFVEPRLEFWQRFEQMAQTAVKLIQAIPLPESLLSVQERQVKFFQNFASTLATLKELARKELAQESFSELEIQFLRKIVEIIHHGSGEPSYTGWYFGLFYKGHEDSKEWDAIVVDVHTNMPDEQTGDPGGVLHQAIGNVNLLLMAVGNDSDRTLYLGPVLSHFEFMTPLNERLSDSEWKAQIQSGNLPRRPEWQQDYLIPKMTSLESPPRI